ncbi:MAG: DJ-1/PfpI family protein [bacterium]
MGFFKIREGQGENRMLKGKKALFIIAHQNFRDEEYAEPRQALEKKGVQVTVASSSLKKAKGMLGMIVQPDMLIDQVKTSEYDLVVFVGGSGSSEYWKSAQAHRIARSALEENRIVAAICIAPVILAEAGLLEGRKATVFSSPEEIGLLKARGAVYMREPVVRDGRIITASGPDAADSFAERIIQALSD